MLESSESIDARLERKRLEALEAQSIAQAQRTAQARSNYLDEKLAVLLKHLPALRAEGVFTLKVDGIEVQLRPVAAQDDGKPPEEPPAGRDPVTFGLPPGTKLPSLRDRRG